MSAPAEDYLGRARSLIERAIRRRWNDGLLTRDPDGVFTAFLGADHIERLMQPKTELPPTALIDDYTFSPASPLGQMIVQLGLRPSQADLLAVLLACDTDPTAVRLVTYLGGNQAQFTLTVDLIFEIVYRARRPRQTDAAALLYHDLQPQGFLQRLQFLVMDGTDTRVALAQGIRLHQRVASWLLGHRALAADLAALSHLCPPQDPVGECDAEALEDAMAALSAPGRLLLVEGPAQSGRELLVRFAAARLGVPLLVLGGQGLGAARLLSAFREACLHGALVCLRDAEDALEGEGLLRLRECLDVFPGTVAILGAKKSTPALCALRPAVTVTVRIPPHQERLRLWRTYLGGRDGGAELEDLRQAAALYNLGTAGIVAASAASREMARFAGGPVRREHITRAVRQLFEADLSAIATRAEVSQTWDDLVLPEETSDSVAGVMDRIRFRGEVMGDWGFARKLGKGLGLTVLFSGEPGTGKSMVAGLIARELGLDLYVIDLSRIMSKWLGETEKNLAKAFDAAESGHVLLLFDEADTVLGKRASDIKSSNDRHANLETNFILARLEQFQGVAIFTTNLPSAVDAAVMRRMSAQVHFPFPDPPTRAELWRRMLPDETPTEGKIDFEWLGQRYEVSGGFIRNIVLRAAYAAVRDGSGIGMEHLKRATEMEYRERGSLIVGGRLA